MKIKAYMYNPGNFGPEELQGIWPTNQSNYFEWSQEPQEVAIWVDTGGGDNQYDSLIERINQVGAKYNIMVLVEPMKLCPKNYEFVKTNHKLFDVIFSTYLNFGDGSNKFKYYRGGLRSYIQPSQFKVHPKSKNISCVMSNRRDVMPGYAVRHESRALIEYYTPDSVDYNNPSMMDKHLGTMDYRYEIVIKNEDDDFFSEKILDAMLVGCIPIYWTEHTQYLSEVFNMDGIITFTNAPELSSAIHSKFFTEELYNKNIKAINDNFSTALNYVSFGDVLWNHGLKDFFENKI